jgi:polysaccharide export outer membrane protein
VDYQGEIQNDSRIAGLSLWKNSNLVVNHVLISIKRKITPHREIQMSSQKLYRTGLTILTRVLLLAVSTWLISSCSHTEPERMPLPEDASYEYIIGAGDVLDIFVWRNPELSMTGVPVRPDGKLSTPLVEDVIASGKTPKQLAAELRTSLSRYVKDPLVTVIVRDFVGDYKEQIRVIGAAAEPKSLSYKKNMTVLDVMIAVGGLNEYASGNSATLIRQSYGKQKKIDLRLEDLLQDGDISANVRVYPGDVIIIPEAWF